MNKKDWYFIFFLLTAIVMISMNELDIGLGIFAYLLLAPLAVWLFGKAYK